MAFLCIDGSVTYMSAENISLEQSVPQGIYQLIGTKFGSQLNPMKDFKLTHGKIYGTSQERADHIVKAFKSTNPDKNLGVLLSGGRGLGKTLTTRLVIEQLKDDYPIISVSQYTADLADFLSHVKGCVILMDEFEKFMGGNIQGNEAEDEQTKQETILSVLDGNTGSQGNLFLLTVNNTYKLDENLLSRPGRIRYHFRYESEAADVVRDYCKDNLNDKSKVEEVVKALGCTKYVSMDIISSFVDELNRFPEKTPDKVKEYFNIDSNITKLKYDVMVDTPDGPLTYTSTYESSEPPSNRWFYLKKGEYKKILKARGITEGSTEEENMTYTNALRLTIDTDLPAFIYGSEMIDSDYVIIDSIQNSDDDYDNEPEKYKAIKCVVSDPEFASYSKKYNKNSF